ncbi:hypothetical protein PISMIDRAFT_85179, partial [Pisolithus microcarpus 441]
KKKNGFVHSNVVMTQGMKVMVTENMETDLDITNGACGTVVGIVCHPDEQTHSEENEIMPLGRLPVYILVKMDRT